MVRYSRDPDNATKAAKARASHIRVHYKHCREIAQAIRGKHLLEAKKYLENVVKFKAAIPFTKYVGGIGRHAVGKQYKACGDKVSWPIKATKVFIDLLRNVESNAETKGLELDQVRVIHAQANQAPNMRRRTYRAHGRINPYMSCPAHIEIFAEEKPVQVSKEKETLKPKLSKKRAAQLRSIKAGGGI